MLTVTIFTIQLPLVGAPGSTRLLLLWLGLMSVLTFLAFGWDKWLAGRAKARRIPEATLVLLGAAGGWLGGLAAMLLFRHKTAKFSFQLKYALGLLVWAGLLWVAVRVLRS